MDREDSSAHETFEMGGHRFPGLWPAELPEDFPWLTPPQEHVATCDACYMAAVGEYRADCQCCTYYPQIANYMVGLALKEPRSRDAVIEQIEAGGALPRELVGPPGRYQRSIALYARGQFGLEHDAICPFFDGETTHCHIYPYRNSVCSTFICSHDHGEAGEYYWERLQQLVGHVEQALSQFAMDRAGLPHDGYIEGMNGLAGRIADCTDPDTGLWPEAIRRQLWGDWFGREVEFFEACADVVLEHQALLYPIACRVKLRHAVEYEHAVRDWMPEDIRDSVPAVAEEEYAAEPIPSLYYKVQLASRTLWQLPFGGDPVVLAPDAAIVANPLDDENSRFHHTRPQLVKLWKDRLFLHDDEAAALRLFETPRYVDGELLERPEIDRLPQPRETLAVWLRRGFLVERSR